MSYLSQGVDAALLVDRSLAYPDSAASFSPDTHYPEYPFSSTSSFANPVYEGVRNLLAASGLDEKRRGTASWNPLGCYIAAGDSVFVLCNFVYHRKSREHLSDFQAKCVHGSVLRAVIDYVLIAVGPKGNVSFGNAPVQACNWERVLAETEAQAVLRFYARERVNVRAEDLRMVVASHSGLGRVLTCDVMADERLAATIDLGDESLLAHLPAPSSEHHVRFRVSDYDPRSTEAYHQEGAHRYVVNKAVLNSDAVVSLSKLKTHNKVGITCGLKGFVGSVAHKGCLAHHRFGPPSRGGDEYSDSLSMLLPVSRFYDWVLKQDSSRKGIGGIQIVDRSVKRILRQMGLDMAGSWSGNDTAWRMALDIARILTYSDPSGNIEDERQRRHLSFIDGIVAGEGEGPLAPSAAQAGALVFSEDVASGDRVAARLMGFDPDAFPIIREALSPCTCPISRGSGNLRIVQGARAVGEVEIEPVLGRQFRLPRGWRIDPAPKNG